MQIEHRTWVPRFLAEFTPNKPLRVIEVLPWDLDIFVKEQDPDDPEHTTELHHLWEEADRSLSRGLKRFTLYSPRENKHIPKDPWHPEQLHSLLPILSSKGILHFEQNTGMSVIKFDARRLTMQQSYGQDLMLTRLATFEI